jgi:hypothetical protein
MRSGLAKGVLIALPISLALWGLIAVAAWWVVG